MDARQKIEAAKLADPQNRRAGDYEWRQLSMWDFAAPNQIELYAPLGGHVFHYVLLRITEVDGNRWKTEPVTSINGVPSSVLTWREGNLVHRAALATHTAEIAAREAEIARLRVSLRPFAALLEQVASRDLVDEANVLCQVSVTDMRRAHDALTQQPPKD